MTFFQLEGLFNLNCLFKEKKSINYFWFSKVRVNALSVEIYLVWFENKIIIQLIHLWPILVPL